MTQKTSSNLTNFQQFLRKPLTDIKIKDLNISTKPIVLDSKTDPKKAIEILLENKIMAAPVVENNKFIGVLDLRDTVKFALEQYNKNTIDKVKAKAMEFLSISPQIVTSSLKYLSRMRQFAIVSENDKIFKAISLLSKSHHIVGVINNKNELISVISQGKLFLYLSKIWKFDKNNDMSLSELEKHKYVTSPVITIKADLKADEAFKLMASSSLSGLAVVNKNGKLIHNTSATDIKLWLINSNSLDETIEQFLINIRKLSILEKFPVCYCTSNDMFSKTVAKLQATKYHRLWVVDNNVNPQGVISLTDIFKLTVADM